MSTQSSFKINAKIVCPQHTHGPYALSYARRLPLDVSVKHC